MKVLFFILVLVALCSAQPPQQATPQQNQNDADTLNYALTLEHLEATYYTEGLQRFNESDFIEAGYSASVRSYIDLIRQHEDAHVAALTGALNAGGYQAVGPCLYNFEAAYTDVNSFIYYASILEETGVKAYDGAANTINSAAYLEVAATIATIEARHSAFLNELRNNTPFPSDFDSTATPEEIVMATSSFFVPGSCPNNLTLPQYAFEFVPLSSNYTYFNQSGQEETQDQINNDNEVLNYALTLELFGQAFYTRAAQYTQADFEAAGFGGAYPFFQMIIRHEQAHVRFLQNTLASRNAAQAQPCTYNIQNYTDSVIHVLQFARMLENLEVTAYDGAINDLTNYRLIQGAATIATVEARHGQYLNNLLLNASIPQSPFDATNLPAQILNITAPLFGADCVAPQLPVQAYTLQAYGTIPYPEPTPSMVPSYSTAPTVCPTPTPTPSSCGTPTPSPCGCAGNNNNDDDGGVTINFYFADILRGL